MKRSTAICASVTVILAISGAIQAATLYVSAGSSIQAAIEAASSGDQIEVASGTYIEAINFNGKAVRLYSTSGPAATTIDGNGCDHVVQCVSGEGPSTVLEGFTITGGNAYYSGGGMYNDNSSSPTVTNCTFTGNSANFYGGGMFNTYYSNPTITNCAFTDNSANLYGGGGMYNMDCSPTVTNCTFNTNTTNYEGGGMFNATSNPTVTNCTFTGNSADWGGGMYNCFFSPVVTEYARPNVINCVFTGNSAINGGGMLNDGYSSPNVTNCIVGRNSPNEIIEMTGGATIVTYSDVQGGWTGVGNINTDPLFVDAANGNYRLRANSPCIDAGFNGVVTVTTDLDGNPRIQGACVDMGAYEASLADPPQLITNLIQDVVELNIPKWIANSLNAKLYAASKAIDDLKKNNDLAAVSSIQAFISAVKAQRGKAIPEADANALIDAAQKIIDLLTNG